jgi:hypothetical protein
MKLKPGTRLHSQVDATEVIVVRSPAGDVKVACGGQPMIDVAARPEPGLAAAGDPAEGTKLGKRYTLGGDPAIELLVTKPGKYSLSIDGAPLVPKEAKPLPASD